MLSMQVRTRSWYCSRSAWILDRHFCSSSSFTFSVFTSFFSSSLSPWKPRSLSTSRASFMFSRVRARFFLTSTGSEKSVTYKMEVMSGLTGMIVINEANQ